MIFLPTVGKWHLGWDKSNYGDQIHGPLGHGFDHFYGLPFTLVDGFQYNNIPFLTYSNLSKDVSTLVSNILDSNSILFTLKNFFIFLGWNVT